jgi:mRNA interferase RelE/StbE
MASRKPGHTKLRVPDETADLIRGMHPQLKKRVRYALGTILEDPASGKALQDDLAGLRSYRLGRFRIIYRISSRGIVEIVAVGPRRDIYEATYRIVRKHQDSRE